MFPPRTGRLVLALTSVGLVLTPSLTQPASAADPLYVNTSSPLPALTSSYDPASADDCIAGRVRCIDKMIKDFRKRFEPLAKSCSHNAPFAMMYLRVSQTYRWSLDHPELYRYKNPGWMNHVVAVFGTYYTSAYDNWVKGNRAKVPTQWLIALDAASGRQVTIDGNLLLGANAHINRDLAFSMAAAGLVDPGGVSGKHDYDVVNDLINTVTSPLDAELAARFDPTADGDASIPGAPTYTFTAQLMADWREQAWRNAEALVNAKTEVQRAQVAAEIEAYASAVAQTVRTESAYNPPLSSSSWCPSHYASAGPLPYVFGYAGAF